MATFQYQHPTAAAISWRINVTFLSDFSEGISTVHSSDGVSTLTIVALPKYNSTVIECVAVFFDSPTEETTPAIMIVQGKYTIACESLQGFT